MSNLVLTSRKDEPIYIGDNVTVTVLDVKGKQVRLSIEAPREIGVFRKKALERVRAKDPERVLGGVAS